MVTVRVCSKLKASKKRLSRNKGNRLNPCKSQRIGKVTTQEARRHQVNKVKRLLLKIMRVFIFSNLLLEFRYKSFIFNRKYSHIEFGLPVIKLASLRRSYRTPTPPTKWLAKFGKQDHVTLRLLPFLLVPSQAWFRQLNHHVHRKQFVESRID